ncbi:hypothetical protein A2V54_02620 [candidate division WWE3 bacterium RBG_19FT_COMBO_53_11]|uniref:Uncharacterized protein n=1 Tax=candidate division WWE3 bacterium RBG_19FT_COMBO_53_11 TaxID=1802613 RepID=A0A1F4UJI0_UNCKA|nr:MAG: hypothetical protein A2V54_02620 [candidate division WWE3 bacterium RBG_19FT_COMBO_53_11]
MISLTIFSTLEIVAGVTSLLLKIYSPFDARSPIFKLWTVNILILTNQAAIGIENTLPRVFFDEKEINSEDN